MSTIDEKREYLVKATLAFDDFISKELACIPVENGLIYAEALSLCCIETSVNLLLVCARSVDCPIQEKQDIMEKSHKRKHEIMDDLFTICKKKLWEDGQ